MDEYISKQKVIDYLNGYLHSLGDGGADDLLFNRGQRRALINAIQDISAIKAAGGQPVNRWIDAQKNPPPIIDRRSMTSESVLILRDNGRCAIAYYCNDAEDGSYWTTDDDKTMYCWEEVTHWQPLPKLPKEGDAE